MTSHPSFHTSTEWTGNTGGAAGTMAVDAEGDGRFTKVTLHHGGARCFILYSVTFPVEHIRPSHSVRPPR